MNKANVFASRKSLLFGLVVAVALVAAGVVVLKGGNSTGSSAQDAAGTIAPADRFRGDKSAGPAAPAPAPVTDANAPATGSTGANASNASNASKASKATNSADSMI